MTKEFKPLTKEDFDEINYIQDMTIQMRKSYGIIAFSSYDNKIHFDDRSFLSYFDTYEKSKPGSFDDMTYLTVLRDGYEYFCLIYDRDLVERGEDG